MLLLTTFKAFLLLQTFYVRLIFLLPKPSGLCKPSYTLNCERIAGIPTAIFRDVLTLLFHNKCVFLTLAYEAKQNVALPAYK